LRQPGGFRRRVETFFLNAHDDPCTHAATPRSSEETKQFRTRSGSRRRA
jgi:hypothetical protein